MNNANKPAYPVHGGYDNDDPRNQIIGGGLTKREYFAAMAMQKMIDFGSWDIREEVIKRSIDFADELLKQLEQ